MPPPRLCPDRGKKKKKRSLKEIKKALVKCISVQIQVESSFKSELVHSYLISPCTTGVVDEAAPSLRIPASQCVCSSKLTRSSQRAGSGLGGSFLRECSPEAYRH